MARPLRFPNLVGALADILAPPRCVGCLQETTWLCATCRGRVGPFPLSCIGCERPQARGLTCDTCRPTIPLTGVIAVGGYTNVMLQRAIGWLKYKGVTAVAPILASLLVPRLLLIAPWADLQRHAVFVPIPLHRNKQRERGFNQSEQLAAALAALTGIPTASVLIRQKSTWTQSKLPKEMRQANMVSAFSLRGQLPEDRTTALLLDDVTTTGNTLTAAAHALKSSATPAIWGATIARG